MVVSYVLDLDSLDTDLAKESVEVVLRYLRGYSEIAQRGISTAYVYLYMPGMYTPPIGWTSREDAKKYLLDILVALESEL
jgi:hypothetical protein